MPDRSEVRAGVFVVTALLVLMAGTLWIVGFSPMRGRQVDYEVVMKSSGGVRPGDRLRVAGVDMGRVKTVVLNAGDEWPVVFHVSLNDRYTPTEGSLARITTDGLLGAPYLEIVAGPADAPELPEGSRIEGMESGSFNEVFNRLGTSADRLPALLDEATDLLTKINHEIEPLMSSFQVILSEENIDSISRALATIEPTVENAGSEISSLVDHLKSLTEKLEASLEDMPGLATEIGGLVTDLRRVAGPEGDRLIGVLDSAESAMGSAHGALSTVENNSRELDDMLRDLRDAAANLKSLTQTLKERPSLLLRYPRPPEGKTEGVDRRERGENGS
ncbi:MAG: MlaD family protein [Thermoanaerobaculia bacterium]